MERTAGHGDVFVRDLADYKSIAVRGRYKDVMGLALRRGVIESMWPRFEKDFDLISTPSYLLLTPAGGGHESSDPPGVTSGQWIQSHETTVQSRQEKRQHHIHLLNDHGERVPLNHCQVPGKPGECKSGYPKEHELLDEGDSYVPGYCMLWVCRMKVADVG